VNPHAIDWTALGEQLGQHAWPLFLGLLALAVVASGGVATWYAHGSAAGRGTEEAEAPVASGFAARLGTGLVAGLVLLLCTGAVFTGLARLLGDGSRLQLLDEALSRQAPAHVPAAALRAFGWLTHFGEPMVLTALGAVVALLLWRAHRHDLVLCWEAALAGNALLNPALKAEFARERPLQHALASPELGFSFPSGHSSGAIVAYGMLAYLAWRLQPRLRVPAAMAAAAVVLTTAASRVFLQVHFASDVLAGLCSGLGWLALCIGSTEFARHRAVRRSQRLRTEKPDQEGQPESRGG
jgi:membrane-associated phospholipid phosphatase